ncbi:hypothetical protein IEQ34_017096 [Dendrobium chrysotoxum]|uniref:TLDc domain-containing protein n=1 Tax=Dendrobium chrysotoxum TaxID=161865 RepID=A0AAV7G912_DENCH|nr:hypothetical protein IEQ34_017096 [Dendrobium chrysotoxum]
MRKQMSSGINVEITFQSEEDFFSVIGFRRIICQYMCQKYDMTIFFVEYATELSTDSLTVISDGTNRHHFFYGGISAGNFGGLFAGTRLSRENLCKRNTDRGDDQYPALLHKLQFSEVYEITLYAGLRFPPKLELLKIFRAYSVPLAQFL